MACAEFLRHLLALRLVGGEFDVARGRRGGVEDDGEVRRRLLGDELEQRVGEAVDRGGVAARRGADRVGREGEMGAVNQRHAVEEEERVFAVGHGLTTVAADFAARRVWARISGQIRVEMCAIWRAMASGENSWSRRVPEVLGVLGKGYDGTEHDVDGVGERSRNRWAGRRCRIGAPAPAGGADAVGGDDGPAEDERLDQGAGEGVEERRNDDDLGELDLADDLVRADLAEIFDARARAM